MVTICPWQICSPAARWAILGCSGQGRVVTFVFFCIPDTTGRSLEEIKEIFDTPAFSIWRVAYAQPKPNNGADADDAEVAQLPQSSSASSHSQRKSLEKNV